MISFNEVTFLIYLIPFVLGTSPCGSGMKTLFLVLANLRLQNKILFIPWSIAHTGNCVYWCGGWRGITGPSTLKSKMWGDIIIHLSPRSSCSYFYKKKRRKATYVDVGAGKMHPNTRSLKICLFLFFGQFLENLGPWFLHLIIIHSYQRSLLLYIDDAATYAITYCGQKHAFYKHDK